MQVGDLVFVSWQGSRGFATIISVEAGGFYTIVRGDRVRLMHHDYLVRIS